MSGGLKQSSQRACPSVFLLAGSVILSASASLAAQEFGDLPPPPTAPPAQEQALYYLTLAVNGLSDNLVVPVTVIGNRYAVDATELTRRHIKLPANASGQIDINTLPDVTVFYDNRVQQLQLTIPTAWLPQQQLNAGDGSGTPRLSARSSTGLLFNYNLFYTSPPQQGDTMNALMEQRLFSDYGTLSNSGLWVIKSPYTDDGSRYRRYDTYWRYSDSERMVSYQFGDLISNSLTWSQSARMAGLRIGRNFNLRPDIVTYPMLQYAGSAAVPSTLDLFINGFKTSSMALNSGPFTLTNTPYLNGAGEATIITTDAQGRQIATSVPFYVSNTLLRQGLSDFDLSVGVLRQTYGLSQDRYASDPAFSGFYRYGVTQNLTLAGHGETVRDLTLFGAGADMAVGRWGTLSTAYSHSERSRGGQQYVFGYSYYGNTVGFNVQHQRRTSHYQDLSTYITPGNMSKESLQATLSSALFGSANGTVGIGYFAITPFNDPRTELVNLSYTRQLWGNSTLYLAANKTLGDRGYSTQLQVIIPFGSNDTFNTSVQRNNQGESLTTLGVTRTLPLDGGFGWNLAYSAGNAPYHQGALSWRGPYNQIQGGIYGNEGSQTQWGEISGSVIYLDGSLFPSNRINDAFIVVDTQGYADVPVRYENQLVGHTNQQGRLLIPWVTSHYPAKVEIDPLALPPDIDISSVETRLAVKEGSGALASFALKKVRSANVALRNSRGEALRVGTWITDEASGSTTISGHDGWVYFAQLGVHNRLSFTQEDGRRCHVQFSLPEQQSMQARVGPLTCQPDNPG